MTHQTRSNRSRSTRTTITSTDSDAPASPSSIGNAILVPAGRHIDRQRRHRGRLTVEGATTILRGHIADVRRRDPAPYSSHSLPAGFVTEARARGVPDAAIMRRTGHTSAHSLHRYDRPEDLLADATHYLGEWW